MFSMTGFGHARRSLEEAEIVVDVKSVNGRYFDFRARLARELIDLEPELKNEIQKSVARGRVELLVDLTVRGAGQVGLNRELLENYLGAAEKMRAHGIVGELTVSDLTAIPGLVSVGTEWARSETLRAAVKDVVREAVGRMVESRGAEGREIRLELARRIETLDRLAIRIGESGGRVKDHYRDRLDRAVAELAGGISLDESRLAQELLFYVERSDISEELERLRIHLNRFRAYLEESDRGPVGKNLDFLCQELNREVNTILAKACLGDISETAVEAKSEVERIREQVQNVE